MHEKKHDNAKRTLQVSILKFAKSTIQTKTQVRKIESLSQSRPHPYQIDIFQRKHDK